MASNKPNPGERHIACPSCRQGAVSVTSHRVFDLYTIGANIHMVARSLPRGTTILMARCGSCGLSWKGTEFEAIWAAAGRPTRP